MKNIKFAVSWVIAAVLLISFSNVQAASGLKGWRDPIYKLMPRYPVVLTFTDLSASSKNLAALEKYLRGLKILDGMLLDALKKRISRMVGFDPTNPATLADWGYNSGKSIAIGFNPRDRSTAVILGVADTAKYLEKLKNHVSSKMPVKFEEVRIAGRKATLLKRVRKGKSTVIMALAVKSGYLIATPNARRLKAHHQLARVLRLKTSRSLARSWQFKSTMRRIKKTGDFMIYVQGSALAKLARSKLRRALRRFGAMRQLVPLFYFLQGGVLALDLKGGKVKVRMYGKMRRLGHWAKLFKCPKSDDPVAALIGHDAVAVAKLSVNVPYLVKMLARGDWLMRKVFSRARKWSGIDPIKGIFGGFAGNGFIALHGLESGILSVLKKLSKKRAKVDIPGILRNVHLSFGAELKAGNKVAHTLALLGAALKNKNNLLQIVETAISGGKGFTFKFRKKKIFHVAVMPRYILGALRMKRLNSSLDLLKHQGRSLLDVLRGTRAYKRLLQPATLMAYLSPRKIFDRLRKLDFWDLGFAGIALKALIIDTLGKVFEKAEDITARLYYDGKGVRIDMENLESLLSGFALYWFTKKSPGRIKKSVFPIPGVNP